MLHRFLIALMLAACSGCLVTASREPWAPLELHLDGAQVASSTEAYVYVDGEYRGNFVDGRFRIYLTLAPHEVRVNVAGYEAWQERVTLTRAEYPDGRVLVVRPVLEE